MRTHAGGCASFWAWAGTGALVALSAVSFVGVLTGPIALVALVLVARRSRRWPEPLGLLAGFGGLCVAIATLNRGGGGVDPAPWLSAGVALAAAGVGGYWLARRSSP